MAQNKIENTENEKKFITAYKDRKKFLNRDTSIQLRERAIKRFTELGFPTNRIEEWKYTNIQPLLRQNYSHLDQVHEIKKSVINKFLFGDYSKNLLVFINGIYSVNLSSPSNKKDSIIVQNIEEAKKNHPDLLQTFYSKSTGIEDEPFTLLNMAFFTQGAFVYIPDNFNSEVTVHILNISDPRDVSFQTHPRNLVYVGKNTTVNLIESNHYLSDYPYFYNVVNDIKIAGGGNLTHINLQNQSSSSYRISKTEINQDKNSVYTSFNVDLGGSIVRNNLKININGENSETNLYGFYLAKGKQHIDNFTIINHLVPNCNSNELYKGILGDNSRGVFSGTIYVARDAQKTNAFQSNKNLLLSENAEADSKPQLKIYADDVKCSHGATIGQLDEESLFYLRQRGISESEALTLLKYAFVSDVLDRINIKPLKEYIESEVNSRLKSEF